VPKADSTEFTDHLRDLTRQANRGPSGSERFEVSGPLGNPLSASHLRSTPEAWATDARNDQGIQSSPNSPGVTMSPPGP
jgi:hypothetical protein